MRGIILCKNRVDDGRRMGEISFLAPLFLAFLNIGEGVQFVSKTAPFYCGCVLGKGQRQSTINI